MLSGKSNGYGDYVRAALVVNRTENRPLIQYLLDSVRKPEMTPPSGVPSNLSRLDLYRLKAKQLEDAMAFVRRGNAKNSFYPDLKASSSTLYPELARFRELAHLFADAAEVAYQDGQLEKGADLLFEGLQFADGFESGPSLSTHVATTCRSILFKTFRNHFSSLTQSGLRRLSRWSRSTLQKPSQLIAASIFDRESHRRVWFEFCNRPKDLLTISEMPEPMLSKVNGAMQKLTLKRRGELYDQFLRRLELPWRVAEARLRQPENRWLDKITVPAFVLNEGAMRKMKDPPGVTLGILGYIRVYQALSQGDTGNSGLATPTIQVAAAIRNRARVVGLYATVGEFRLAHRRLPKSLAEAGVMTLKEPTTGQPYVYEPGGRWEVVSNLCAIQR